MSRKVKKENVVDKDLNWVRLYQEEGCTLFMPISGKLLHFGERTAPVKRKWL